jgi:hypothetical protein
MLFLAIIIAVISVIAAFFYNAEALRGSDPRPGLLVLHTIFSSQPT